MNDEKKYLDEANHLWEIANKGFLVKIRTYFRLSGPGWLQSAISLGGGSLAGSLYLGVLAGYSMLWLQPLAMLFGIIMLSALSYITFASGQRPFQAINQHVNPVLGWGWALRRRWGPEYHGLMKFDMATGMFIPFMLATSCVMIAAGSQFHTVPQPGFLDNEDNMEEVIVPDETQAAQFQGFLEGRILFEYGDRELSGEELQILIDEY